MATITISVPNPQVARVQAAFAAAYGYQPEIDGAPNPETLPQFTQRKVREYIKDVVRSQEAVAAGEAARKEKAEQVDTEITLA